MNVMTLRHIILVVLILLASGRIAHAQLAGGTTIATPADEPKTYEDDISDLDDLLTDTFPGAHLSIPLSEIRFKVTKVVLETLLEEIQVKSEEAADDIVKKLGAIKDVEFIGEETFLDKLKETLGEDQADTYKSLILQYALSGTHLILAPQLDTAAEYREDFRLAADANDDTFKLNQEVALDLFMHPLVKNVSVFLQGSLFYDALLHSEDSRTDVTWDVERGEHWLYIGKLFGSDLSLQIGRQDFFDKREWWWSENLDAIRIHYGLGTSYAQFNVAREITALSPRDDRIDPSEDDVLRLFGRVAWEWRESDEEAHWLEAFFLRQHDRSGKSAIGAFVPADQQDESDADLMWFGLRALGSITYERFGRLDYWLDIAGVVGDEVLFGFDDDNRVEVRRKQDVAGWALDVGVTWQTNLPGHTALTLGYAVGSGDRQSESGTDRAFRQTGLQGNSDFFGGNFRFQYYGELLQPELSNLHVFTVAVGFRLFENILSDSSVDFIYHLYRQAESAPMLRNAAIGADPEGESRTIGQEWDLVLSIQDFDPFEFNLIGAIFRAGSAYGELSGNLAYRLNVEFNLSF